MRFFTTLLIVLLSVHAFAAQTKKRTSTKVYRPAVVKPAPIVSPEPQENLPSLESLNNYRPLNSTLFQVPYRNFEVSGLFNVIFGSFTRETTDRPSPGFISKDEMQNTSFINTYSLGYGVLPDLTIGVSAGYAMNSLKDVSYSDTSGSVRVLEPTIKNSGMTDPLLFLNYRLSNSNLIVDLSGGLRLGFQGAERGTATDTNADLRGDVASSGTVATGSYGASGGLRVGYFVTPDIAAIIGAQVDYNFDGQITYKQPTGDYVADIDSSVSYTPKVEAEYFITKEFSVDPFVSVAFNPKQKAHYTILAVPYNFEVEDYKEISVGITGTYLITHDIALRGGYTYMLADSAKTTGSIGGVPTIYNTKDRDAHSLMAQVLFQF